MNTLIKTLSIIALSLCGLSANAYDFMVNGIAYNINSDQSSVTVTYEVKSSGPSYFVEPVGSLVLPSTVSYNGKSYSVVAVGPYSFWNCSKITSVVIPNSVVEIGDYSFASCGNIQELSIGNNVETIGKSAFGGNKIENLVIPNSVKYIGLYCFRGCSNLKRVVIGDGVVTIGFMAFDGCEDVDQLIVGESVLWVGGENSDNRVLPISKNIVWNAINCNAFVCSLQPCDESVKIGNKVRQIPGGFLSCHRYQWDHPQGPLEIVIPESVERIGHRAFFHLSFINKDLTIPESVNVIEGKAFQGCGLESVRIPNATIWSEAFSGNNLKTVIIGAGVNRIDSKAFLDNEEMVSFHNQNPEPQLISDDVFSNENYLHCILYVPSGSVSKYKAAQGWQLFRNIVGEDSGIEDIVSDQLNLEEVERYSLDGCRLSSPQLGINIVRYSDGSFRKVLVPNN